MTAQGIESNTQRTVVVTGPLGVSGAANAETIRRPAGNDGVRSVLSQ